MPILDVHEVGKQRIPSQTLNEVLLGLNELASEDLIVDLEECLRTIPKAFLQRVNRHSVRYELHDTTG